MNRHQSAAESRDVDVQLGRAWRDHRRHLLDIGLRMLGNLGEAEDAVQEAFARLVRADLDEIDDVGGWLVVVVSRLCIDKLRARRRHPTSPELSPDDRRANPGLDPADRITLDDNVRIALQLVLERLTPAERTAFVLHDVFQYPFDEIAEIVGRTPVACRQLAARARRTIAADAGSSRFRVESADQRRVTEQFIATCTTGDLDGLLAILDPDVAGWADLGGGVFRTDAGAAPVAAGVLRYLGPASSTTLLSLPAAGEAGVVALRGDRIVTIVTLTVRDGRIEHIDALVDPAKLAPIAKALGTRQQSRS
jgi:RNA polymerase sigma-70 factor (ECF subfamily)